MLDAVIFAVVYSEDKALIVAALCLVKQRFLVTKLKPVGYSSCDSWLKGISDIYSIQLSQTMAGLWCNETSKGHHGSLIRLCSAANRWE